MALLEDVAAFDTPGNGGGAQSRSGGRVWLAAGAIAIAGLAVYWNALRAPFIFDDIPAIVNNPAFPALRPTQAGVTVTELAAGTGIAGRPVVRWSLELNYAVGGADVRGYHLFNVLVHIAAALALLGAVRRTLELGVGDTGAGLSSGVAEGRPKPALRRGEPLAFATAVALLWLVHPLQTESVTCVIQRTESLAALFYLLTLYAFIRGVEGTGSRGWMIVAWLASALGAATKEVLATVPVVLWLYDRTFVAGSFAEAWRRRGRWHLAFLATWVIVALSVWSSGVRGGAVGFGQGVTAWKYALTQCRALALYLKLAFWPHPQVLDYGRELVPDAITVGPQGLLVLGLLGLTVWALVRCVRLGFLGAWFFVILAPSSSFLPLVTQTMAEHRMYLPLAALAVLVVLAVRRLAGRAAMPVIGAVVVVLAVATVRRNAEYLSVETLWRDNLANFPANARVHFNLAQLAEEAGRYDEAVAHGLAAVEAMPDDAAGQFNLAVSFAKAGRRDDAVERYKTAIRLKPVEVAPYINLSALLMQMERRAEALVYSEAAVRLDPGSAMEHFNLAQLYFYADRTDEALTHYLTAARLDPASALVRYRLGHAYVRLRRFEEARAAFAEAVRLDPKHFEAQANLAATLLALGRNAEAVTACEAALRLKPGDPQVTANLETARALAR